MMFLNLNDAMLPEETQQSLRENFQRQDYEPDAINEDVDIDLEKHPSDRPHQITSTALAQDPTWVQSSRILYGLLGDKGTPRRSRQGGKLVFEYSAPDADEISDEDIGEWGLELLGQFNWNLPEMMGMVYKLQGAPLDQRIAFYNMMTKYEELPNFTWDGSVRMLKGLGTDITTYLGIGTLGAGFLAKQAAAQAGKSGIKDALRATLPAGIVGGIEGGAFTSIDDAMRQHVAMGAPALSGQSEFDISRNLTATGIGTAAGLTLGTVAPIAIPAAVKAGYRGFKAAMEAIPTPAPNTFFTGVPTGGSGSGIRSTGVERGQRVKKAYRFRPGEKDQLADVARNANLSAARVQAEYKRLKELYPESEGWSRFEVEEASEKKGKIELKITKIPYGFEKNTTVDGLSSKMVDEVVALKKRFDDGDPVAATIWEHRKWYSEMRQRLRAEFGGFGDVFADVIGTTSAQTNVQQNWENAIEVMHRFTRGEFDDALTKLDAWLKNGGLLGSGKVDGEGYVDHHYRVRADAEKAALENGASESEAKDIALEAAQSEFPLIAKRTGKLFNANSPATMMALLDLFRDMTPGSSPKTPNFTGNLIGFSDKATIDVWAARNLRRLANLPRVAVVAEDGVAGKLDTKLVPGAEFGFGQDVYAAATAKLRQQGIDLNDDDLQAVVWFLEKEIWTKNGWTTRAGEGGSLETEADFAGVWNPEGVKQARSTLTSDPDAKSRAEIETKLADPELKQTYDDAVAAKAELGDFIEAGTLAKQRDYIMQSEGIEDKDAAVARVREIKKQIGSYNREIKKYEALQPRLEKKTAQREADVAEAEAVVARKVPARRLIGGLSLEREGKVPSDMQMGEAQGRLLETGRPDDTITMLRFTPTTGRYWYQGDVFDERSIDFEYIARENHDPEDMMRQLVQEAKDSDQDSAFFSEVVKPGQVADANPGVEIYFNRTLGKDEIEKITEIINDQNLNVGFTYATDLRFAERQAGGADTGDFVGLRLQYIPEFAPDGKEGIQAAQDKMEDLIISLPEQMDFISNIQYNEYDTRVFFKDDYDEYLAGNLR
jgi:hypothetical protein